MKKNTTHKRFFLSSTIKITNENMIWENSLGRDQIKISQVWTEGIWKDSNSSNECDVQPITARLIV